MTDMFYDKKELEYIKTNFSKTINDYLSSFTKNVVEDKGYYDKKFWNDFNSLGLRSAEFKKNHDGKHVLFMGCSETQGSNDCLEDTWAQILYSKINNEENLSGYFNLSKLGSSLVVQILDFLNYVNEYGKPDEVFFLIPETSRSISYDDKSKRFEIFNMALEENRFGNQTLLNAFANSVLYLKMFELFCKNMDIKFIWSTWTKEDQYFKALNFDNFLYLDMKNFETIVKDNFDKYQDSKRSVKNNLWKTDGHFGLIVHKYWAEMFYKKRENENTYKKN